AFTIGIMTNVPLANLVFLTQLVGDSISPCIRATNAYRGGTCQRVTVAPAEGESSPETQLSGRGSSTHAAIERPEPPVDLTTGRGVAIRVTLSLVFKAGDEANASTRESS